jgi:hypothetical protein
MTCRSSGPARRRSLAACAAVLAVAGCGSSPEPDLGPRLAVAAFLQQLARGDAPGMCRTLSAAAAADLARDFGGSSCETTAAEAARYVAARPGQRAAVRGVVMEANYDTPLSPAPFRAGATTAALRLVIDDPVLASRQAFDVRVRLVAGRWRVDGGMNALFTLVRP